MKLCEKWEKWLYNKNIIVDLPLHNFINQYHIFLKFCINIKITWLVCVCVCVCVLVAQSHLTLRNPMNYSLPKWKLLSPVWLLVTPCTIQSMEFSRPEYWSGSWSPSPGALPNPGIEPRSSALQADSLPVEPPGKPQVKFVWHVSQYFRKIRCMIELLSKAVIFVEHVFITLIVHLLTWI